MSQIALTVSKWRLFLENQSHQTKAGEMQNIDIFTVRNFSKGRKESYKFHQASRFIIDLPSLFLLFVNTYNISKI